MVRDKLINLQPAEQQALIDFVQQLRDRFENLIQSVELFGSKARADSSPDSDIDVLIIVDTDDWRVHKQISYLATDISLEYDLILSPHIWSISHLHKVREIETSLYRNIQREGISLFQREPVTDI